MFKKIFIILFIIIFCVAAYFPISFFLNRAGENKITNDEKEAQEMPKEKEGGNASKETSNENSTSGEETGVTEESLNDETSSDTGRSFTKSSDFYVNVTPLDCTRECEPYKDDTKELEYCQNVCGLSPPTATEDCGNLSGLEKDYCIKDVATREKNPEKCNEIKDTKIKETCQNRIQEEFIEGNF